MSARCTTNALYIRYSVALASSARAGLEIADTVRDALVRAGCWLRATTARGYTRCSPSYGTVGLDGQSQSYARAAGARGAARYSARFVGLEPHSRPSWRGAGALPRAAASRPSVIGAGTWCRCGDSIRPSLGGARHGASATDKTK